MRIGTRLVLSLAVPLVLVMGLFGYVYQRTTRAILQEEMEKEWRETARTVGLAIEVDLRDSQIEDVRALVDQVTGYERVLGLRIYDRSGTVIYQPAELADSPPVNPLALRAALERGVWEEIRERIDDEPALTFVAPLADSHGAILGAVQLIQYESFLDEAAAAARRMIATLTVLMILIAGTIVFLVARASLVRPLADLETSMREVGASGQNARVPVRRSDELGRLAQEFNRMCERLDAAQRSLLAEQEARRRMEARLRTAERLASLGRLASGLAHEIGTPLNVIGGRAERLLRQAGAAPAAEHSLRIIVAQIDRIARIVRGMLDFARAREPHVIPVDINGLAARVLDFLGQRFEERGVHVAAALPAAGTTVAADADQIQQVFLNLCANALDAMPGGGTLTVRCEAVERSAPEGGPPRPYRTIVFEDTGCGIAPENLERIFDPFFTTKDVGSGTGLGLSVSYGIVREHGGFIDVDSAPGRGTRFVVCLPEEGPSSVPAAESAS